MPPQKLQELEAAYAKPFESGLEQFQFRVSNVRVTAYSLHIYTL